MPLLRIFHLKTVMSGGVNLSRLERDRANTWTGKDWTWSCVGVYSMHIPELYGYVQFSDQVVGTAPVPFEAETW